jgi:hypothetical protein
MPFTLYLHKADAIVTNDHRWQGHTLGAALILLDACS